MKLKDLKRMLNKMTKEQLEQELLYNSKDKCISGVANAVRQRCNLYCTYEDDPSDLYTRKELIEKGLNVEDIEECGIEIPKGALVIEF